MHLHEFLEHEYPMSDVFVIENDQAQICVMNLEDVDYNHHALMCYLFKVEREHDYRLPIHKEMRKL